MFGIDYYGTIQGSLYLLRFCLIYKIFYFLLDKLFINSNSYFILQKHKRMYILKNIIKSISMFIIFLCTTNKLFRYFYYDKYNHDLIRFYGGAYVANDLLALLIVDKLPETTIIHHRISVFMYYVLISFDINSIFVLKLLVLYTFFSYCAFMVNLYLGLRYFIKENNINNNNSNNNITNGLLIKNANAIINNVRICAYYNYIICCTMNWTIHFYFLINRIYFKLFGYSELLYFLILIPIIRDDLILMSWLTKKYNS